MPSFSSGAYDAVIIGAGIGGLVCGCYLAKSGMKVLVIEQHDKPGGYFTSFKRKGFVFDAAAHSFGNYREGGHVRKIFSEIGVSDLITINRFDPSDVIIAPDFKITFSSDTSATLLSLTHLFPKEEKGLNNYFRFLTTASQDQIIKLKDKTFDYLLRSFFKDEKLISAFSLPVFGNGGLPSSRMHAFSGSKIFSEFIIDGGYYPDGGIQKLPDALAEIIRRSGGEIVFKKRVKKILVENNSVIGVALDHDEIVKSRYVVSACDMIQTFKSLLEDTVIEKLRLNALSDFVPSISTFILYIGIDAPFAELPPPGSNIWYLPHYNLDKMYDNIQQCNLSEADMFMLRVSPDRRTIVAFIGAPFRTSSFWKESKKKIAEDFLTRIEKIIPSIRKHIVYFDAATPSTLYRYTLNYQGAAFGWAKTPSQTFDPILSKTTPVNGLFLTGHWTSIAFGMPGTCYSGQDTAARILRKEKAK